MRPPDLRGDGTIAGRLAARTLELIDIVSVGRDDGAALSWIRSMMPRNGFELAYDDDGVLFYAPAVRRPGAPFVVLAGHVDTVPVTGNVPGSLEVDEDGEAIVGRGASDMKGALTVMVEVAEWLSGTGSRSEPDMDVGLLFFGREELPFDESALIPFFARCPLAGSIDLAIVMEPTDNAIEIGCLGNLNARVVVHGTAAHSARPWLGDNAVHRALRVLGSVADLPDRDVEVQGLVFREVMSVTTIRGGVATNVIPDRVEADVNFRYAPSHTPEAAEARLRELMEGPHVDVEVVGNAPPGPVNVANPLIERLRRAGDLPMRPKQAWTPVAEFAANGIDAVNLGPGDPQYAHRDDERIRVAALDRAFEVMRVFMTVEPKSAAGKGSG